MNEELLKLLSKLWRQKPSQRFGQLLFNYTRIGTRATYTGTVMDPFHYQDEDIIKDLKEALE